MPKMNFTTKVKTMNDKTMKQNLKKFTTEELDILYGELHNPQDAGLRKSVKEEIYSRVDRLQDGKKGK